MNWISKIVRGFTYFIFLFVSVAAMLEIVFRFLPTSDSLMVKPVNAENPILKFMENREITRQIGFNFAHVNTKRINNYGYATDKKFQEKSVQTKPVISVIGDSYVEAVQVKNKDTFHAILDENFESFDVYPIGVSGSPLSQYLAFAHYASNTFAPKLYVFLIISNDFDESFESVKKAPGFHYFDDVVGLKLMNYEPTIIKRLARRSAFVRYLHLDLKLNVQLRRILGWEVTNDVIRVSQRDTFLEFGRRANEKFLNGIKELSLNSNVIIVLDGDRAAIYSGLKERNAKKPVNILFNELGKSAKTIANIDVIDLHKIFRNDYAINSERFNYDYDSHWNEHGHAVAGQALTDKLRQIGY